MWSRTGCVGDAPSERGMSVASTGPGDCPPHAQPRGPFSQPGYWEQRYAAGDTPWNKGRAHPELVRWLAAHRERVRGAAVAVPGCGFGWDALAWLQAGASPVGIEVSGLAVEAVRRLHHGLAIEQGSVFEPAAHLRGRFDWVFEHTCLCALSPEDRPLYARGVWELLKPGGRFMAIFYRNPDHPEGPPFGITEEEIRELFCGGPDGVQCAAFRLLERWQPVETFEGREGREEVWMFSKLPHAESAPL